MRGSTYYLDAEKVRAAMFRSGKSKEQIMNDSGFGRGTINHILNPDHCRDHVFAHSTILAVAAAMGCTAADLLADGTKTQAPAPKPAQRSKTKQSDLFEEPARDDAINRLVNSWTEYLAATNRLIDALLILLARR